jgi:hypothetical protein
MYPRRDADVSNRVRRQVLHADAHVAVDREILAVQNERAARPLRIAPAGQPGADFGMVMMDRDMEIDRVDQPCGDCVVAEVDRVRGFGAWVIPGSTRSKQKGTAMVKSQRGCGLTEMCAGVSAAASQHLLAVLVSSRTFSKELASKLDRLRECRPPPCFPGFVEADLLVEPVFEPFRLGRRDWMVSCGNSASLTCRLVGCSALSELARRHQEADLGERGGDAAALLQRASCIADEAPPWRPLVARMVS